MTHASTIGTGTTGRAVADAVTSGGRPVGTLGRADTGTAPTGDVRAAGFGAVA